MPSDAAVGSATRPLREFDDAPDAIVVDALHIRYKVYADRGFTVRRLFTEGPRSRVSEEVHAVRGVDLVVKRGEVLGIVGSNGSGKSTLLGAIAGLIAPAAGQVLVSSQPALLGVGAALKPELSGRKNIMIGCLAMGMQMPDIRERLDDVIEFSELREAIDRPLRTYSSGMRARLSFSVATLRTPEILLIDEALAVGDKRFREKSLGRIREMQHDAGTIVMVTHNLNEIRISCTTACWIDEGVVRLSGEVGDVLEAYESATL